MYFQEFILWVNQPWAQSYMQRVVTAALSGGAKDGTQMPVSGGLVHYSSAATQKHVAVNRTQEEC